MKNTLRSSLLSFALLAGCLASDTGSGDTGTTTVTLTAADLDAGVRPVIDLTLPGVRWVVDASEGAFDPNAFEVRTPRETVTLADWLKEAWGIDDEDVVALGQSRVEIGSGEGADVEDGVGQHGMELRARCDCDLICDDDLRDCYMVCICPCEPIPGGGWRCPLP